MIGMELTIFLTLLPECQGYRHVLPGPALPSLPLPDLVLATQKLFVSALRPPPPSREALTHPRGRMLKQTGLLALHSAPSITSHTFTCLSMDHACTGISMKTQRIQFDELPESCTQEGSCKELSPWRGQESFPLMPMHLFKWIFCIILYNRPTNTFP